MNEAERGLAAYKASAQKPKKKRRKRVAAEDESVSVHVNRTNDSAAAAQSTTPQGAPRPAGKSDESPAEKLLKKETDNHGYRKVAKFLLLLGKEEAAKILKHFAPEEVEEISLEIAQVNRVDDAEAQALLAEFGLAGERSKGFRAGSDTAKSMLTAAFGESRAKRILSRVVPEVREKPFQFLGDIDPNQILLLLKNESAPTIGIVMPYLPPQKASKVLQSLSPELQRQVIRRIAKLKKVDPEVIVRIEGVLKERIRTQGRVITEEIDGRQALADILKFLEYSQEEKILDELASSDPELSENVKDRLFTIELVFDIDDAELQSVLRDYDDEEIAVILKAKDERVQERILSNLSTRRQQMVREEMVNIGRMRKSEVDSATKDFVDYLVELDDQRKITIHRNDKIVD